MPPITHLKNENFSKDIAILKACVKIAQLTKEGKDISQVEAKLANALQDRGYNSNLSPQANFMIWLADNGTYLVDQLIASERYRTSR